MKLRPKYRLVEHFAEIDDPRIERTKRHKLIDILTIAILAVICGAEDTVLSVKGKQAKTAILIMAKALCRKQKQAFILKK